MIKVAIFGIGGMLGSVFSRFLLNRGYEVYGMDNFLTSHKRNLDPRIASFWQGNACEASTVNDFFYRIRPDYVVNFAAEASEILSPHIRRFSYHNNLISHANIINECVNYDVKKVILTSSIGAYGHSIPPFTEETPLAPADPYSLGKEFIEKDAQITKDHFGLDYSIVRPFNLFCKFQAYNQKYRNAIAIWIRRALNGEDLGVFGAGDSVRSFSSCHCLNEPLEKLLFDFGGETFNIGSEKPMFVLDACKIVQKTAEKYGFKSKIIHWPERREVKVAYSSTAKAQKLLDFKDDTDIEKLVDEMFVYAMALPKDEVKKVNYEIFKGLPPSWL